jgi:Protein of unknown function (DUF2934)
MARSKSIPGSKTNRVNNNKEQTGASNPASIAEVKAVSEEPVAEASPAVKVTREASAAPEAKVSSEARTASEPRVSSEGRKFEVMKTESRKNVVPINLDDEIRRRAYELFQQRGSGSGSEAEDWLNAEREIRQRYRQQSA